MPPGTRAPRLEDVLAEWLRAGLARVHTALPATVVAYDATLQRATVQPVLHGRVDDPLLGVERPEVAPPPPIPNVPVVWPSGAARGWSIHGPLLPGDPVLLVVAERSTDTWRTTGAPTVTPLDARRFDLSDAFALPGGRHYNPAVVPTGPLAPTAVDPVALVLAATVAKLGSSTAIHPVLHGDTYEADLLTWLSALDALLTALATPGAPTAWIAAVNAATVTFQAAQTTFKSTITGNVHKSLKVFSD